MIRKTAIVFILNLFVFCAGSSAAANVNLVEMSLEELMNVEITSVSKTPQALSETPAAVYVISHEDIHRSGMTTIPDLLRTVPGVQVGRIDASTWGVSIRGFNDRFANKQLVLMDGRSVYTPLFSGTFWNLQDTNFEDIDRIEVVRGPGGTTWGANAVNGVINIITKSAKDTQGGYASGGYGTLENGFGDARYGGKYGDGLYYRFYKKYYNRGRSFEGEDDWEGEKLGGRADWEMDPDNLLTIQGDYYGLYDYTGSTVKRFPEAPPAGSPRFAGPYDEIQNVNSFTRGRNVLGRYTHTFDKDSDLSVQAYYDFTYLDNPFIAEARDTYDVDARYRFPLRIGVPQEIIADAGYRYSSDQTRGSYEVSFNPANRSLDILSWSVQDEIRLVEDFLTVWVGSKFEVNDFTGFEYQPSARGAVYPDSRNTVWGSITRAVRTPSRAADDLSIRQVRAVPAGGSPLVVNVLGGDDVESEVVFSYEAGVKSQVTDQLNTDVAAFYNEYDGLITTAYGRSTTAPTFITTLPLTYGNHKDGETYGAEVSLKYFLTKKIRLNGGYSYLKINIHEDPALYHGATPRSTEEESPNHQASGGVSLDLPWNLTLDAQARYVSELPALGIGDYLAADVRIAWKPKRDLELSIVGVNLFDAYHYEFKTPGGLDFLGEAERTRPSVYGKVEAKF